MATSCFSQKPKLVLATLIDSQISVGLSKIGNLFRPIQWVECAYFYFPHSLSLFNAAGQGWSERGIQWPGCAFFYFPHWEKGYDGWHPIMFHDALPCSMPIEAGHSLWGVFTDQDVRFFTFPIEKKVTMNDIPSCSTMPVPVGCRLRLVKACAGYSITRMRVFLLSPLRKRLWRMTPHHVPWCPSLLDADRGRS